MPPQSAREGSRKQTVCPRWARRLFLEDVKPEPGEPGYRDWCDAYFFSRSKGVPDLAQLWATSRDELLREWMAVAANAGRRPPAWWRYEAPEMRRVLPGQGAVTDESPYSRMVWPGNPWDRGKGLDETVRRLAEGIPRVFPDDPAMLVFEGTVKMESQASLLKRHGLLIEDEEERLEPSAFEPEVVELRIPDDRDPDPSGVDPPC